MLADKTNMDRKRILKNTSANFLGKVMNRAARILLVPFQIQLLGEEAFGLIGFYGIISNLITVLDFGLSLTSNREIARLAAKKDENTIYEIRDLIRTYEVPYWMVGGIGGVLLLLSVKWISNHWIIAPTLSEKTISFSLTAMGILIIARWPISLYIGILFGLQRQVEANIYAIFIEVLNGIGSLVVLIINRTIEAFFLWQIIVGIIEAFGYVVLCWSSVKSTQKHQPRIRIRYFIKVWRYAMGINIMSVFNVIFSRLDGLILSKILPINYVGYYSIAQRIPTLTNLTSSSILPATTPVVIASYETKNEQQLRRIYHQQSRWLIILGYLVAFPFIGFAYPILRLWTQSENVAQETWIALALIATVSILENASNVVNQFSLACGYTHPAIIIGFVEGLVLSIGTILLAPELGIAGAAISYSLAKIFRYIFYPILLDRLILKGELKEWFLFDTIPVIIIGGIFIICAWILQKTMSNISYLSWALYALILESLFIVVIIIYQVFTDRRSFSFFISFVKVK